MDDRFSRTQMLLGREAMERLSAARVAVFGVGGVGGFAVEALARSGIGALDLIDHDCVDRTNLNRQIIATESTIGRRKTDVAAERIADISPSCRVRMFPVFFSEDTKELFDFSEYDYVVDAIDSVTAKLLLIMTAKEEGVPVISAMGAGNKLDPSALRVADLYDTNVCPLARVMRRECRKRGIRSLKVVYSEEIPLTPARPEAFSQFPDAPENADNTAEKMFSRRAVPGSVSFVPSVAGLLLAGEVIKDLIGDLTGRGAGYDS